MQLTQLNLSFHSRYVDIWALGILLYFMTTGVMPFRADTVGKLKRKILEGVFVVPEHVSAPLKYLITSIIQLLAIHRATMPEMMRSEWLEGELTLNFHCYLKIGLPRLVNAKISNF